MYAQAPAHTFSGLDLVSSVDEAEGAIDLLNVDLDVRGALRVRDGYDNFTSSAAADRYKFLAAYYKSDGTKQLLTQRNVTMQALNTSGNSVATNTTNVGAISTFARFGAPGTEYMYIATGNSGVVGVTGADNRLAFGNIDALWRWNGAAFAQITTSGLTISPSRVHFSDEGTPETFTANNYVDLNPGDGEILVAMLSWQENLFVFKESKFFVFYGNTTGSDAVTEFNYRPIYSGVGAVGARAVASAPEGVYFCSRDGVYLTSGSVPERISDPISPIFTGRISSFFASSALNQAQTALIAMTYLNGRLYVSYPSGSATACDRTLVYDTATSQWTLWDLAAAALGKFRFVDTPELVFAYASGSNHIGRFGSAYTTDDGTAIAWRYRTGFTDFGNDLEKRIVKTRLMGTGSADVKWSRDFGSLGTAKTATLGTSPAIAQAVVDSNGKKGRIHSWQFGGSGQAAVYRAHHELDPPGQPDLRTS